jgi:hypothetical protein
MVATLYVLAIILAVLYITYPKEFPQLISDPKLLVSVISMETRRRWMIVKLGTMLFISRQRMKVSLWKMKSIIKEEQLKQQQQNKDTK